MPKTQNMKHEPLIETTPLRLTADETRLIIRLVTSGKPINGDFHAKTLAEIGILQAIPVPEETDTRAKIAECWKRARAGVRLRDLESTHQALHDIERLQSDRDRNDTRYRYILSDLGKQIARGVSIRLGQTGR